MKLGDIVRLKVATFGARGGTRGYVYLYYKPYMAELAGNPVIQVISEDGKNLGAFNNYEQEQYLDLLSHSGYLYEYVDDDKLDRDWAKGVFDRIWR